MILMTGVTDCHLFAEVVSGSEYHRWLNIDRWDSETCVLVTMISRWHVMHTSCRQSCNCQGFGEVCFYSGGTAKGTERQQVRKIPFVRPPTATRAARWVARTASGILYLARACADVFEICTSK